MNISSSLTNGRVVIPAALRTQLDIKDGDLLIWSVRDGELIATTRRAQLNRAQALFQKHVPANAPSLADELMTERRAASEQE